jgi:hypothetical protein
MICMLWKITCRLSVWRKRMRRYKLNSVLKVGTISFSVCNRISLSLSFYILLTMRHVMILGKWPTWRTVLYRVFICMFNSLHVSNTSCLSSGETNCVKTTTGNRHAVSVAVSCAGRTFTPDLHTIWSPIQSDSYQRLYWHNLSLLMMSTTCSKNVEG